MIPSRIVPHILLQQLFRCLELARIPQTKALHQPLPIAPDMIVLHVQLKHLHQEVLFALGTVQLVYDGVAVVPNLVVLLVFERNAV